MNIEELNAKRSEAEAQFEEKKAAREAALSQAASLLEDMHRLQGAYNAYTALIEENTTREVKPAVKVKGEKK